MFTQQESKTKQVVAALLRITTVGLWVALDIVKWVVYKTRLMLREHDRTWHQKHPHVGRRRVGPKPKKPKYKYLGKSS